MFKDLCCQKGLNKYYWSTFKTLNHSLRSEAFTEEKVNFFLGMEAERGVVTTRLHLMSHYLAKLYSWLEGFHRIQVSPDGSSDSALK
jgi:hypothetical protein